MDRDSIFIGFLLGIIALSTLLSSQYGWAFQMIKFGGWSANNCLKPQTLIIFPSFTILYLYLFDSGKYRIFKALALTLFAFVLQDSAFMHLYFRLIPFEPTMRNEIILFYSLSFLLKSNEISKKRLVLYTIISMSWLYFFTSMVYEYDMNSPYFILHDSTLKMIPCLTMTMSFKKI